mmetsp:Transcript_26653/g.19011  ORF Transcript_26653/g.19011 Transcript_26653/m.19011 type:complete len:107 (+) Transcript_26653:112-432(+)
MFEHELIEKLYNNMVSVMGVSTSDIKHVTTNEQNDDEEAGSLTNLQLLHELNENYASGFSTPEHTIDNLKHPAYEKFFSVFTSDETKKQNKLMLQRMTILYGLYLQ